MDKQTIRKNALLQRSALTKVSFWELNEELLNQFMLFDWEDINVVHLFLPISEKKEVDTFEFINFFKLYFPNLKLVVSRTDFKNLTIIPILFDPEHTVLVKNQYQIPEPLYGTEIDPLSISAVIIPLLAFDKQGNRVGYGAGFYDRFLAKCKSDVLKIGVSLFEPLQEIADTNAFDVKLTHCITPKQTFIF